MWLATALMARGRVEESSAEIRRALELDPFSPVVLWMAGRFTSFHGDPGRAIELLRRAVDLNPQSDRSRWYLREAYAIAGREAEAAESVLTAVPLPARNELESAYRAGGQKALLEGLLRFEQERSGQPCAMPAALGASLFAQLGDAEGVFRCLQQSARAGEIAPQASVNPIFAPYRSDPRYAAYLEAMNLRE